MQINDKKIYEMALRIVQKDHFSSFTGLLSKDKSFLLLRCINIKQFISRKHERHFSNLNNHYNTLNVFIFSKRNVKAVRCGSKTMSYMNPKLWDLAPKEMKQCTTPNEFRAKIKIWRLENCSYRLSKHTFHRQASLHNAF